MNLIFNRNEGMTTEERKAYVVHKATDRAVIQKEIQLLNKKRQEYILSNPSAKARMPCWMLP